MAPSNNAAIRTPPGKAQRARGRCEIVHLKPRVVWTCRFSKKSLVWLHHAVSHGPNCHNTVTTRLSRRARCSRMGYAPQVER